MPIPGEVPGIELVAILSIGQNRWMFRTTNQSLFSFERAGMLDFARTFMQTNPLYLNADLARAHDKRPFGAPHPHAPLHLERLLNRLGRT